MASRAPRWLDILNETLSSESKNPTYTLATVLQTPSGPIPRSRSVIHRGIIAPSPSRPLLTTTTDVRSPKAHQLTTNHTVEATFWFPKTNLQFRITASTYLLPGPGHHWHALFPGRELTDGAAFDWDEQRLTAFDGLSKYLRASFVRPVPGSPMKSYDEAKEWPQTAPKRDEATGDEKHVVEEALGNFALVVLDPTEVDLVDLVVLPNRRTVWTKKGDAWEERIVVP
ncbi:pyridoxamine 5'-phosphate oxidase-domain-containing protein [Hysterangium stoloniferum]|nr:pyridoxamine 5'-phosphate oxidase-domain-containing protein [Hysterangium stoloniferum]